MDSHYLMTNNKTENKNRTKENNKDKMVTATGTETRAKQGTENMNKMIDLPTVGEILKEEFMEPLGISAYRLAKDIFVPVSRIQAILSGSRKITVDTSIRLGKYFGVSFDYFINIQNDLDIRSTSESMMEEVNRIQEVMYN